MAIYNPKSLKAEEFISDEEILDTLSYAKENKANKELIRSILEKAGVDMLHVSGGMTIKRGSSIPAAGTKLAAHAHLSEEINAR